jgi:hypothetical protein
LPSSQRYREEIPIWHHEWLLGEVRIVVDMHVADLQAEDIWMIAFTLEESGVRPTFR